MIVVDTSVWVDVRNDVDSRPARTCIELIENGESVALTEVIFAQLPQGLRSDAEATEVERHCWRSRSFASHHWTTLRLPRACIGLRVVKASLSARRSTV